MRTDTHSSPITNANLAAKKIYSLRFIWMYGFWTTSSADTNWICAIYIYKMKCRLLNHHDFHPKCL